MAFIEYVEYDKLTGSILGFGRCLAENYDKRKRDGYGYIEGIADRYTHKVNEDGTGFVEYTVTEKEDILYSEREGTSPPLLDVTLSDNNLNIVIDNYFFGRVDVAQWRIDNYSTLRELAYPDSTEKVDAEVKINSGIEALVTEGEAQLAKYIEDCLNVKTRFPKE